MAETRLADIIVPEVFNDYVIERTAAKSALYQSGIIARNTQFDALAASGGQTLKMPFWQDLTGNSEVLSASGGSLTVNNIGTDKDIAVLLTRGKAWGSNDLAQALSGSDPMAAIGDLVGDWWARDNQSTLLKILEGIFGAATMSGNVHDISAEAGTDCILSAENFIDATQLMGDARGGLAAVMMHSAAVSHIEKLDLIDTMLDSEGKKYYEYRGKRIIEDDTCPLTDGVYTSYIFGPGAIAWGEGGAPVPTETAREALASNDILINRRHFIMHPRGVAFQSAAVAGASPTNAELATASNWARVYEAKNVRIIQFKYRIAAAAGS
jgi:hypothetical protein